jgi:FKBP-type peptidyl-prolyl cis-trans isomerase SlyD
MAKGDIISIEFTGKEQVTGTVFDTTNEELAKKSGIFNENQHYGPVVITVGKGELLKGIDSTLEHMKAGEKKSIALKAKEAFGERSTELVRVLPLNEFKKHNVSAVPGTIVNVNDMSGRVQSVSGGRVRVDFNPEMAGKDVEYDLHVVKVFTTAEEKAHALAMKHFPAWEKPIVKIVGDKLEVHVSLKDLPFVHNRETAFAQNVLEAIPSVKKIEVMRSYTAEEFKTMQLAQAAQGAHAHGGHYHEDGSYHEGTH